MNISLKTQISLFLLFFVALIFTQQFFAHIAQQSLIQSFEVYQQTAYEDKLVRNLEKNVLDLQRQVLIFKDTGSASSKKRFETLIDEINIG